jgi:hypothetical protein
MMKDRVCRFSNLSIALEKDYLAFEFPAELNSTLHPIRF